MGIRAAGSNEDFWGFFFVFLKEGCVFLKEKGVGLEPLEASLRKCEVNREPGECGYYKQKWPERGLTCV